MNYQASIAAASAESEDGDPGGDEDDNGGIEDDECTDSTESDFSSAITKV